MGATERDDGNEFGDLTDKQGAVLALLANGRTSKEIASALDLSESAVNRRIELLRIRFGGITRLELARRYRDWMTGLATENGASIHGVEIDRQRLRLALPSLPDDKSVEDKDGASLLFRDSLEISIDPPWKSQSEPQIVPRVLDGKDAVLTRGAAIAVILVGIIASLVLGLAAAGALTATLGR